MGIDSIFAILSLFLLAAFFAFLSLFAAVAHGFLLNSILKPLVSLVARHSSNSTRPHRMRFVDRLGAVEGGLDVGHDVLAAYMVEEARLQKELRRLLHRST